ncbi:SMI1/KNR4 family protein [Sphingomonas sp. KR1UV-12]|uniref:SMI1/KNR4 family protein n=1 Tax=Sphingomonas aurea TaxID=3063994 RepID=A0ABT9EIJ2_9SPHN|nr:SMI1/KNR4 family protein [Sphingomonas sp. KR1UV-12]MDP1026774.1 SMI1/KNR4 family protein [Sphingomonas sp. KR1UV-12]
MLEGRDWHKLAAADDNDLRQLEEAAPVDLPASYLAFLRYSNGGEGPLPVQPLNLCLYPAEEVAQIAREGTFTECFQGLFVIGDSGGGEAVALDLRSGPPFSVVSLDMTNTDCLEATITVAASFDDALSLIGLNARE